MCVDFSSGRVSWVSMGARHQLAKSLQFLNGRTLLPSSLISSTAAALHLRRCSNANSSSTLQARTGAVNNAQKAQLTTFFPITPIRTYRNVASKLASLATAAPFIHDQRPTPLASGRGKGGENETSLPRRAEGFSRPEGAIVAVYAGRRSSGGLGHYSSFCVLFHCVVCVLVWCL